MFKSVKNLVWAFDAEWTPDPVAGRVLYHLGPEVSDSEVIEEMWRRGGATEKDPTPYLKTILCRILSIAAVQRQVSKDGRVILRLLSLPKQTSDNSTPEVEIIRTFLGAMGERQPQLVGFNSLAADLRILVQRGIVHGLCLPDFARRPNKPWEGVDYFAKGNDWHIDLKDYAAPGWGPGTPSLHELAVLSGIPGKMETHGNEVPRMWLEGRLDAIVAYNECDALSTYLIWLRMAHFSGLIPSDQYAQEQELLRDLAQVEGEKKPHLLQFLAEWDRLAAMRQPIPPLQGDADVSAP